MFIQPEVLDLVAERDALQARLDAAEHETERFNGLPTAGFTFAGVTYIVGRHPDPRRKTMYLFQVDGVNYTTVARFTSTEMALAYRDWMTTMVQAVGRGAKLVDREIDR